MTAFINIILHHAKQVGIEPRTSEIYFIQRIVGNVSSERRSQLAKFLQSKSDVQTARCELVSGAFDEMTSERTVKSDGGQ